MAKRTGRKAELRRLAAKQGWYDGRAGNEPEPPMKIVMRPNGGTGRNPVPLDEEQAYWDGYDEGRDADQDETNPYTRDATEPNGAR